MIRLLFAAAALTATACSAQTQPKPRSSGVPPFKIETIGRFDSPFAMAFLPEGFLLVTEKAGKLKLRTPDGKTHEVIGVPRVAAGGQGGLLDVAVAPSFALTRTIYLSYAEPSAQGSALALARATLDYGAPPCFVAPCPFQAALKDLHVIWRSGSAGAGGQFGAAIAFDPDGRSLYLSSGERQRFTPAQDPDQALGKIVRLTLDGEPWRGNPGYGTLGKRWVIVTDPPKDSEAAKTAPGRRLPARRPNITPAETWSTGHRNPYGLAFDDAGRLWEAEMGPRGGDEINLIRKGRNYGWPLASNGDNYNGVPIPDHKEGDGFEAPKVWWNPSISPGGIAVYRGAMFPAWKDSLLVAGLGSSALLRVTLNGDTAAKADQWDMGERIRDVAQAPDGSVWLIGDGANAPLLRLTPK